MLPEDVKARIQSVYSQMLEARDLTPRYGQRLMIAEICKALADIDEDEQEHSPIMVVEAGTGTGKTLAYLLAVLPLAQVLGYRVVVATATIALQEQIVFKDIPELQQGSDLAFSVSLAKGRGRYVCLAKLDLALQGDDSLDAMRDLYGEELAEPEADNRSLYDSMLTEYGTGNWDGDRDGWQAPIADRDWRPITVDRYQCSGPRCSFFRNCAFYRARNDLEKADCIVANHDLVLTDLALGGGAILPEPSRCIYIFDEAHHLPLKSNAHFAAYARIRSTMSWLERCEAAWQQLQDLDLLGSNEAQQLQRASVASREALLSTWEPLLQLLTEQGEPDGADNHLRYTFQLGQVDESLRQLAQQAASHFQRLVSLLGALSDDLKEAMDDDGDAARSDLAAQWFPLLGAHMARAESGLALWISYGMVEEPDKAPSARWLSLVERDGEQDISLSSSPVLAAVNLQERLWDTCAAAVLTSATLSALGHFDTLAMRAGLPPHTRYLRIASPFEFEKAAVLSVPRMNCQPSDTERHTALIVKAIPQLLEKDVAALMLFSSRRQMLDVLEDLPADWRDLVLCQDDYQKSQLLKYHRQRVDQGQGSIIFGLASFAEGVDLPGHYCTHVLIAKIPFAVPNDPVEQTLSAWVERRGDNPFMTLSVPDAALRLVQASGRLLRSETDSGTITLFDERLVSRHYGKAILESLPPYRREIFQQDIQGSG